jgi:transcriptional regulator with XRE-family HTH domain
MTAVQPDLDVWSVRFSQALKAIRRRRRLSAVEVALRMGMKRRSYSNFEGGRGPFTLERVMAFSVATECDPYAILLGVLADAPGLAARLADNKLLAAFAILMRELNQDVGDGLTRVETSTAMSAFSTAFERLAEAAAAGGDIAARAWLDEELSRLAATGRSRKD